MNEEPEPNLDPQELAAFLMLVGGREPVQPLLMFRCLVEEISERPPEDRQLEALAVLSSMLRPDRLPDLVRQFKRWKTALDWQEEALMRAKKSRIVQKESAKQTEEFPI